MILPEIRTRHTNCVTVLLDLKHTICLCTYIYSCVIVVLALELKRAVAAVIGSIVSPKRVPDLLYRCTTAVSICTAFSEIFMFLTVRGGKSEEDEEDDYGVWD